MEESIDSLRDRLSRATNKKVRRKLRQKLAELEALQTRTSGLHNVISSFPVGCHVAFLDADWIIEKVPWEEGLFGEGVDIKDLPELSLDPESNLLSFVNSDSTLAKSFNVSIGGESLPVKGKGEKILSHGSWTDESGTEHVCVSLVVVLEPLTVMDVCFLNRMPSLFSPDAPLHQGDGFIVSDIKTLLTPHSTQSTVGDDEKNPKEHADDETVVIGFPFGGEGRYECVQGHGGEFTHYFPSNYHAIDFECPVGTELVAVGDGTVVEVRDENSVEGILTCNLFKWNSIMLQLEDELLVEYVHIKKGSAVVKPGESVKKGQVLCASGNVGFSPKPHLHIQVTRSKDASATTIPFRIACVGFISDDQPTVFPEGVVPQIGMKYAALSVA